MNCAAPNCNDLIHVEFQGMNDKRIVIYEPYNMGTPYRGGICCGNQLRQMKLKTAMPPFSLALRQNGAFLWLFAYECLAARGMDFK